MYLVGFASHGETLSGYSCIRSWGEDEGRTEEAGARLNIDALLQRSSGSGLLARVSLPHEIPSLQSCLGNVTRLGACEMHD